MDDVAVRWFAAEIAKYSDEALDMYERARREGRVRRNPAMDARVRRRSRARAVGSRIDRGLEAVNSTNQTIRNVGTDARQVAQEGRLTAEELRRLAQTPAAAKVAGAGENLSEGMRDNASVRRAAFEAGVAEPARAPTRFGGPGARIAMGVGIPTVNLGVALGARAVSNRMGRRAAAKAAEEAAKREHRRKMAQLAVAGGAGGGAAGGLLVAGERRQRS